MVIGHAALTEKLFLYFLHGNIAQGTRNGNSFEDVILNTSTFHALRTTFALLFQFIHNFLQFLQLMTTLNSQGNYKLEEMPIWKDIDPFFTEKIIDICNISSQKVQSMRMVMLNRLWDINHIHFSLIEKHIVFAEIRMDQFALLIEHTHDLYHLEIDLTPLLDPRYLSVFQTRGVLHILTDKVHHKDIWFHQETNRTNNHSLHTFEVSQLFLGPHTNHFTRVAGTITTTESELSLYISIPVFED